MKSKSLFVVLISFSCLTGAMGAANATSHKDKPNYVQSCTDLVNHKHPGLKGAAWKAEWGKCNTDRPAYSSAM
jgi:hypothetical protein